MSKTVEERVKLLIAEKAGVNIQAVTNEASFVEDLNLDSLDLVELVIAIEEEFEIAIPDSDAEKITTVGEAVEYVQVKLFNKGGWGFSDPSSPIPIENVNIPQPYPNGNNWNNFYYYSFPPATQVPFSIIAGSNSVYNYSPEQGSSGNNQQNNDDDCNDPLKPHYLTCEQWLLMNGHGFLNWLKNQNSYTVYKPESWLDSEALANGMTVAGYITDRIGLVVDSMGADQVKALGKSIRAMGYIGTAFSGYKLYTAVSDGNITTGDVLSGISFALGVITLVPGVGTAVGVGGLILLSAGSLMFGIASDHVNDSTLIDFSTR